MIQILNLGGHPTFDFDTKEPVIRYDVRIICDEKVIDPVHFFFDKDYDKLGKMEHYELEQSIGFCPYCGKAVRTAHLFSLVNNKIKASMVDSHCFPELAMKHNVSSVPHIVVNDNVSFVGALPEEEFLAKIMEVIE